MTIQRPLRFAFSWFEGWLDRAFGTRNNPFYWLGGLGFFLYWIVAVSGIYLYAFFDTGLTAAYQSVESLTVSQWWLGGVMRSLHRYASDALILVMAVHLLRVFAYDQYRGTRWYSWLLGVPTIALAFAAGITGYWLVWDKLAQYVAVVSTEWLDHLPIGVIFASFDSASPKRRPNCWTGCRSSDRRSPATFWRRATWTTASLP